MRRIIHAHADGKYVALDHTDAVVIDYPAQTIRLGLERWKIVRPTLWRFLTFMLRSADLLQHYPAICEATALTSCGKLFVCKTAQHATPIFEALGMTLETVDEVGLRLHSNPRMTLACCATLAPGLPLPSRVRSMRSGRGGPHMTPAPLGRSSIREMTKRSRASTL